MMNNFDMNWILIFNAIYEEKSISKASKRLDISEKNAGLILKKLRDYFVNPLFIRSHTGFLLTPLSIDLYKKFSHIESTFNQALEYQPHRKKDSNINKVFTLSMSPQYEFFFSQAYNRAANKLTGYIFNFSSVQDHEEEVKKLRHGLTDIYLTPDALDDSFIHHDVMITYSLSLCLILSKKHKRYQRIVEEGNFDNEEFISCTRYKILEDYAFEQLGVKPDILFRRDSMFDLLETIDNHSIILIGPSYFQLLIENDNRFTVIKIKDPNLIIRTLYSCSAKNSTKKEDINYINKIMKNEIDAMKIKMDNIK
ncbi:LysR family transcriptional regulator [Budviciaceae bacterium BWR-B9]|uniref:LysR family transcriptional regulator n=1 Tax=Limnobaculum allomyrinae TaxID=2791986 RepID=A0ABS1IR15_9GAMM|nr:MULTISPECIES: LysR family transcriptional regulator [Limnobaculum]MBK5144201.1 LysR family transcriptional regulator [Limnobaculum allomyrinae]MBV7692055.1 LysR family transcriptional regulator [Limnobaculum sp. M2-1]